MVTSPAVAGLGLAFLIAAAACSGPPPRTGAAHLSGALAQVNSAIDLSGATSDHHLIWAISLVGSPPGTDCGKEGRSGATITIWTSQAETGSEQAPQIPPGAIPIAASPGPLPDGGMSATMEVYSPDGRTGFIDSGAVTVSSFKGNEIKGGVVAVGTGPDGEQLALDGLFDAPYCTY